MVIFYLWNSGGDSITVLVVATAAVYIRCRLCKIKYYNNCLFYNVQRNFIVQTGDPTNTGRGGDSIFGILYGQQARFFPDEIRPHLKHKKRGLLGMASAGENMNASQFYFTTGTDLISLDDRHTIFGEVAEGFDVLESINEAPCDDDGRPLQNIRIRHTNILEDPFSDPPMLAEHIPAESPSPVYAKDGRLEDDWVPEEEERPPEELEAAAREREARGRAVVLEMIGDLPAADVKPPETMLFVCKLNPVTTEEDLEIIFGRFGKVTSCDIIRDWKTGDSLCYAFIGFETERSCEEAYFKMNNVLIDDRRIKVDFSQSVSGLWREFRQHGRRGNPMLRQEAESHQRSDGLRLKEKYGGPERELQRGFDRRNKPAYDLLIPPDDNYDDDEARRSKHHYADGRTRGHADSRTEDRYHARDNAHGKFASPDRKELRRHEREEYLERSSHRRASHRKRSRSRDRHGRRHGSSERRRWHNRHRSRSPTPRHERHRHSRSLSHGEH